MDRVMAIEHRHRLSALDCAIAAFVSFLVAVSSLDVAHGTIAFLVASAAALAWRRISPASSAGVALLCVFAAWATTLSRTSTDQAQHWTIALGGGVLLLFTYSLTAWGDRRLVPVALLFAVGSAVVAGVLYAGLDWTMQLLTSLALASVAWTAGQWRRAQRLYLDAILDRAARAEAHAEQAERLGIARERARIAREMHDVIAHSLTVMTTQADGARYVLAAAPEQAAVALLAIADTGRAASRDMAGLLGVLVDEDGSSPEAMSLEPQPHLRDLDRLVRDVASTGLDVSLQVQGTPADLTPGTEVTVYRAIQESLTNVLKHAGVRTRAQVQMTWAVDNLTVQVLDDGPSARWSPHSPKLASGRGLMGMRERLDQHHGTLEVGPRKEGGFRVKILLPLHPETTP